jgi:hypothetical protein
MVGQATFRAEPFDRRAVGGTGGPGRSAPAARFAARKNTPARSRRSSPEWHANEGGRTPAPNRLDAR